MSNLTKTCLFARNYNKIVITSLRNLSQPVPTPPQQPSSPTSSSTSSKFGLPTGHKPSNLEKRFLVWTGKYKSLDLVPETVGREENERARSTMRIRIANIMMVATLVGCGYMVYSGKQAAGRGESVQKMNIDWHKEYNAAEAEKLAAAAAEIEAAGTKK